MSLDDINRTPQRDRAAGPAGIADGYVNGLGEYGSGGLESSPRGLDPTFYLRVVSRHRWIVASTFFVVVVGTILYTWTTVPVYEAYVHVLTDTDRLNLVSVQDVVEQTRGDTQRAILQSRWMARRTLESLKLLPVADRTNDRSLVEAAPTAASAALRWISKTKTTVMAPYHWLVDPPPVATDDVQSGETPAEAQLIDSFLSGLLLPSPQAGIMDIGYRSPDPVKAARFANAITQSYIDQALETRTSASKEVTEWLTARLNEQREAIESSEHALQTFRDKNGLATVSSERSSPVEQKLNELNVAVMKAKAVTIEKEALYKQARALQNNPAALEMLPSLLQSPLVQQLRSELTSLQRDASQQALTLGDRHPQMVKMAASIQAAQARLQTEVARAVDSLGTDLNAARETEARLQRVADSEKVEAMAMNRKGVELGILEREVDGNRQIYQMLTQRSRETNIAEKLQPRTVRILDPAKVPLRPVSPDKPRMLGMGVLGGLVTGLLFAFCLEFLDNRIKSPDEIESILKLPFLGLVPAVPGAGTESESPILTKAVPAYFSEAIRSMRTSVLFSLAGARTKTLVVTSAGMGEGKTVISTNLAVALASAGQRVLFVDADMRRPRAHHVFGVRQEPGLSNLLVGESKFSDVAIKTHEKGLWMLPAGHRPPNASELLGSGAFREFVAALGSHFDWVIIDSPPIVAVTDASVVAHSADGVVFVVGAEMVTQPVARRAIEQCRMANVNIVGAVLNRVNLKRHAYYYSQYYHRRYGAYYVQGDEHDAKAAV